MEIDQPRRRSQRRIEIRQRDNEMEIDIDVPHDPVLEQMEANANIEQEEVQEEEEKQNPYIPQQQPQQPQQQQPQHPQQPQQQQPQHPYIPQQQPQQPQQQQPQHPQQPPLPQFPHKKPKSEQLNISPSQFLSKIPNRQVLRDFLTNEMKLYCPPLRDMNKQFVADVLSEKKFLLESHMVKRVHNAPQFKEFSTKNIWVSIHKMANKEDILKYFPTYAGKQIPSKQYMIDVVNTLNPGLIMKTIQDMKKKRQDKQIGQSPIKISSVFAKRLAKFQTISNNTNRTGIGNIIAREYAPCSICLQVLKPHQNLRVFKCNNKKHITHPICFRQYYHREPNPRYLCPMRCPNPNFNP